MTPRVGIVTGFSAEAALLAGRSWRVAMAGGRPERAAALAEAMVTEGAQMLVSFGIAGGLDSDLSPGAVVVADGVWTDRTGPIPCAEEAASLAAALPRARRGLIAAVPDVVADRAAKQNLAERSGALAVDLESGMVARAAQAAGLPFLALRAVADPAHRTLPPAALIGLDKWGRVRLGPVLVSVALNPFQVPGLIRVGLDTKRALAALKDAVPALENVVAR